ncbi:hypothetical protein BCR33DRAFT_723258 [Rhizoclosmatium globosum]|uniref:PH domain-containing protein n=1 Tax=Rhizoclosmatium globosum TaxID=329046 RepID=A0A1Y2BF02_9FUNG|nr:hypothetical protein BCR33DRAFT_723258 [Rhizoclosmatium globosum]|eukprot:ORY33286.1 hypothetical protein BCR33DRAFT_723258 [Rhizoclosmatium globosum]
MQGSRPSTGHSRPTSLDSTTDMSDSYAAYVASIGGIAVRSGSIGPVSLSSAPTPTPPTTLAPSTPTNRSLDFDFTFDTESVVASPLVARSTSFGTTTTAQTTAKDRLVIAAPPPPSPAALRAIPPVPPMMTRSKTANVNVNNTILLRSNTRKSVASTASTLSLESLPSMNSTGSTPLSNRTPLSRRASDTRSRATSHSTSIDSVAQRPSMASISTAGFMEANDPQLTLRFLLNQPNTMYGIVKREKAARNWLGSMKSTWNPYITVLYGDKLILYHASKKLLTSDSLNGPFYSSGSSIQFQDTPTTKPRSSFSSSAPKQEQQPPSFKSASLYQPPSSALRLTPESEIHVSEKGVYVLKVTGKKLEEVNVDAFKSVGLDSSSSSISTASTLSSSLSRLDFGILEDKSWELQFDNADSMMEWLGRIKARVLEMRRSLTRERLDADEE